MFLVGSMIPAQAAVMKIAEAQRVMGNLVAKSDDKSWKALWSEAINKVFADGKAAKWTETDPEFYLEKVQKAVEKFLKDGQVKPLDSYINDLHVVDAQDMAHTRELALVLKLAAISYLPIAKVKLKIKEISNFIDKSNKADGGVVKDVDLENMETDQATAAQNLTGTMMNYLQPGYAAPWQISGQAMTGAAAALGIAEVGISVAGGIEVGTAVAAGTGGAVAAGTAGGVAAGVGATGAGLAAGASVAIPAIAIVALAGLAMYGIGSGINKFITWLAEQEPISIMLLNQKGQPLQAGLKGADGIIAGQPATLPVITDFTGMAFPADDDASKIWSKLGFSLQDSFRVKDAETLIKTETMQRAVRGSGRLEMGFVDGMDLGEVVVAQITELHDGDTVTIGSSVTTDNGSTNKVRLRFIDAPEVDPKLPANMDSFFPGMPSEGSQWGAEKVRDWLANRLQANTDKGALVGRFSYHPSIKIVYNKLQPVDGYGRILGIIVDRKSAGVLYDDDNYLKSAQFDWLRHSINGEMLTDPAMRKWVAPFITFPGLSQVNGQEAQVGDVTGRYYNIQITAPEE
jgi:hypothetical protein